jgi:hypothetical protein
MSIEILAPISVLILLSVIGSIARSRIYRSRIYRMEEEEIRKGRHGIANFAITTILIFSLIGPGMLSAFSTFLLRSTTSVPVLANEITLDEKVKIDLANLAISERNEQLLLLAFGVLFFGCLPGLILDRLKFRSTWNTGDNHSSGEGNSSPDPDNHHMRDGTWPTRYGRE